MIPELVVAAFERHDVSGPTLIAQADAIEQPAEGFGSLADDLRARRYAVRGNLGGVLAEASLDVGQPSIAQLEPLQKAAFVAAGAVRMFAMAVTAFDRLVDDLNRHIAAAPPEERLDQRGQLTPTYRQAVATLDDAGNDAANVLDNAEDPAAIRTLYQAGALRRDAADLFRGLVDDLPPRTIAQSLAQLVDLGIVAPALLSMSPAQLRAYLRRDTALAVKLAALDGSEPRPEASSTRSSRPRTTRRTSVTCSSAPIHVRRRSWRCSTPRSWATPTASRSATASPPTT